MATDLPTSSPSPSPSPAPSPSRVHEIAPSTDTSTGTSPGLTLTLTLTLVCACQFMVILDSAIVNVALPAIQHRLAFSATGLAWVVNGYLLTFAGLMLLGGRTADLFGHRRTLIAGLALFSASSLVAGLATTGPTLVTARIAQGAGAALLAPATLAVITTTFTDEHTRARAFGAWSAAGGIGGMAGALAGGAITTGLSWRWVFLLNVPIGAALIGLAAKSLPPTRTTHREPLDLAGAATGTAGLAALIYGVMQSAGHGWISESVMAPAIFGLVLLTVFVLVEARLATRPMMPLRLFRTRQVAVGTSMLMLFGGIAIAMWYFTALFLQNVLGYSALGAGLGQTPAAIVFLLTARQAATWLPRLGVRALIATGGACFLLGFGWLAQAHTNAVYLTDILGPMLLIAIGIGLTFPTLMAATTTATAPTDAGITGALATTATQTGGSISLAALTSIAATRSTNPSRPALASGYDLVFLTAAALALAIVATSTLHRPPEQRIHP